jgi:hypothetical protein
VLAGCNNHPTVKATYNCSQCHKPLCEKCVVNGLFCSQKCSEKFQKFSAGYKKPASLDRSGIVPTLVFLIIVGVGVYVAKYHFHLF